MTGKDKIFFGMMILCILLIVGLTLFMRDERSQCLKNPFVYGAESMGKVSCSCTQNLDELNPAHFYFNDTTFDTSGKDVYRIISDPLNINEGNLTLLITDP